MDVNSIYHYLPPLSSGYTKAVCLLLLAVEWDYVISLGSDVCHPGLRQ